MGTGWISYAILNVWTCRINCTVMPLFMCTYSTDKLQRPTTFRCEECFNTLRFCIIIWVWMHVCISDVLLWHIQKHFFFLMFCSSYIHSDLDFAWKMLAVLNLNKKEWNRGVFVLSSWYSPGFVFFIHEKNRNVRIWQVETVLIHLMGCSAARRVRLHWTWNTLQHISQKQWDSYKSKFITTKIGHPVCSA